MSDIKLNFINQSNDTNNSSIVIFQKNDDTSFGELAVAWRVIQNCGQGWNHPFTYAATTTIAASEVEEGSVINAAILSEVNTEIALFGLKSADIVLSGGGPGPDATPFRFTLQHIMYA